MRILIVDDEGIVLDSCKRVLESEGFEVHLVKSADEALIEIDKKIPSLILIDVKMPVHDGLYVMQELKKRGQRFPVILMSGFSTKETIEESYQMGANHFLPKPFTPDELIETVRLVMKKESENGKKKSTCDR
ncbi:MAG: response regulator [Desulfobacterales bacterium]